MWIALLKEANDDASVSMCQRFFQEKRANFKIAASRCQQGVIDHSHGRQNVLANVAT